MTPISTVTHHQVVETTYVYLANFNIHLFNQLLLRVLYRYRLGIEHGRTGETVLWAYFSLFLSGC